MCVKYKTQKKKKLIVFLLILDNLLLVLNGPILDKAFTSGRKRGNGIPVAYSLSQDANAVFGFVWYW